MRRQRRSSLYHQYINTSVHHLRHLAGQHGDDHESACRVERERAGATGKLPHLRAARASPHVRGRSGASHNHGYNRRGRSA